MQARLSEGVSGVAKGIQIGLLDVAEIMSSVSGLRKVTKLAISLCESYELLCDEVPWISGAKKTAKIWKVGLDGRNLFDQMKNRRALSRGSWLVKTGFVSLCLANICQTIALVSFLKLPLPLLGELSLQTATFRVMQFSLSLGLSTVQNGCISLSSLCTVGDVLSLSYGKRALPPLEGPPERLRHQTLQNRLMIAENLGKVAVISLSGGLGFGRGVLSPPALVALSLSVNAIALFRALHKVHPEISRQCGSPAF